MTKFPKGPISEYKEYFLHSDLYYERLWLHSPAKKVPPGVNIYLFTGYLISKYIFNCNI